MFKSVLRSRTVKDRPFPPFAIEYFQQIREQYELTVQNNPAYSQPAVISALFARADAAVADACDHKERRSALCEAVHWSDVFAVETALVYAYPDEQIGAALWSTRLRFREVAGQTEYDEYMRNTIADATKPPAVIRSDLLTLLARIRYLYTFTPTVEAQRTKVSRSVTLLTLLFIALFLWVYVRLFENGTPFFDFQAIIVMMFAGAVGGFISIQQRLQQPTDVDPLFKELQLATSGLGTMVSPLLGGIFAVLLYFVFVSNLVSGDIFPAFQCKGAVLLAGCPVPPTPADWAKLVVWAFIAGFAERFVPDVLTRIASDGDTSAASTPRTIASKAPVAPPQVVTVQQQAELPPPKMKA